MMTSWNAVTDIRNGFTVTAVDYSRLHFYKKVKYVKTNYCTQDTLWTLLALTDGDCGSYLSDINMKLGLNFM